ncbi:hypothetical protein P691DRAFT_706877 [Macrolepiota fuliginosa MF-IS2]|uniref:Uncharacterized protein n=1 Tax=Macrolepiota fuliginosa MF-IS2 TaxID=1400762 RepID=A0A9P5XCL8_9AGAR|nr:hypothetical protein P691DRAFT_706877 [Macrolepiota fuliginosa MF-IS2]
MSVQLRNVGELLSPNGPVFQVAYTALRTVPALAKWLVILLFVVNAKSWPLMWHIRVFRPVFRIWFQHRLLLWRTMFCSRPVREKRIDEWLDSVSPIGEGPFDKVDVYKTRATTDESDYNGHLSNSSYAKTLDSARFYTAIAMFPMFLRSGGWIPLGGTHFIYLREIPMFAQYEVRSMVASWDQKWLFIIHRFVTKSKGKKTKGKAAKSSPEQTGTPDQTQAVQNILRASLSTSADAISSTNSPFPGTPIGTGSTPETSAALKAAAASLVSTEEPDGATLHTIAVSGVCFKIGRITVPPALVIAANGFSAPPSEFGSSLTAYSNKNPPPHWEKAKAVMSVPVGGSTKALRKLFKDGWRDVPESERWWDQALSGVIEQKRKARLEAVSVLRSGMEGMKTLASLGLE